MYQDFFFLKEIPHALDFKTSWQVKTETPAAEVADPVQRMGADG